MMRLLLVEDETFLLDALVRALVNRGEAVTMAASCREALRHLRSAATDAVLTDHDLPDGKGLDLLGDTAVFSPRLRRFLMSGAEPDELTEALASCVIDQFFLKPLRHDVLMRVMHSRVL